jgi:hypothetical protein
MFVGNRIFVGGGDGYIYALYDNGTLCWAHPITPTVAGVNDTIYFSSPAIDYDNNKLYIGADNGKLYCLNLTSGEELWNFTVKGKVRSSPALLGEYVLFTSCVYDPSGWVGVDGFLYSVTTDGTLAWEKNIGPSVSSPAIDYGGDKIYVGSNDNKLYCFNTRGIELWSFETNGPVQSSPAVAMSLIYFTTNTANGTVYCIDSQGNEIWSSVLEPRQYILSSPTIADDRLYVTSDNGYVYCFGERAPVPLPSAIIVTMSLSEVLCDGGETITVSGNASFDIGLPVDGGEVTVKIEETGVSWNTTTDAYGNYSVLITAPETPGIYTVNVTITYEQLEGFAERALTVREVPPKKEEERPWFIPAFEFITLIVILAAVILYTESRRRAN